MTERKNTLATVKIKLVANPRKTSIYSRKTKLTRCSTLHVLSTATKGAYALVETRVDVLDLTSSGRDGAVEVAQRLLSCRGGTRNARRSASCEERLND